MMTRRPLIVIAICLGGCATRGGPAWYERDATPTGRYHTARFRDGDDLTLQRLLLRLEQLDAPLAADPDGSPADGEAKRIVRMLAREAERGSLARVCEHILWKLSSRPDAASLHEIYLLDFLGRCQELIFELGGDDAPTIENLGAFSINASRRGVFLRILARKAGLALGTIKDRTLGLEYVALACDVLERAEWGAVTRIERQRDPEAADYRRSTLAALGSYRDRLGL